MHINYPFITTLLFLPLLHLTALASPAPPPHHPQQPLITNDAIFTHLPPPSALPTDHQIPTKHQSTLLARRLLALSPFAYLSTTYPPVANLTSSAPLSAATLPVSLPEYIADCDGTGSHGGEPVTVLLGLSTAARNLRFEKTDGDGYGDGEKGKKGLGRVSLSVDWWDGYARLKHRQADAHGDAEDAAWEPSMAGLPRMVLVGWLEELDREEVRRQGVDKCFFGKHADARGWEPGRRGAAHAGVWVRVRVEGVYWIGGFGDRAWIGWLDAAEYRDIEEGEWRGVRLPGEVEGDL